MSSSTQPFTHESAQAPRPNLLESPSLLTAVSSLNDKLASSPEFTHDSFVALAKPTIYQHLVPNAQGNFFDFTGVAYPETDNEEYPLSLTNAEFLDIDYRRIAGEWRTVFALSLKNPEDPAISLRPPFVDIDPLERGNVLKARNDLTDIERQLTKDLRTIAELSIEMTQEAYAKSSSVSNVLALHNDLATEADYLCKEASLGDYRFTVSVTGPHYQIVYGRLYPIHATEEPPVGTYAGIRFLSDLMLARRGTVALKPRTPNLGEAPSLMVATDAGPRLCYPLANLASLSLKSFRSLPS